MGPVQIFRELVRGHKEDRGASERSDAVDSIQKNGWVERRAGGLSSLPHESPTKFVDKLRRNDGCESDGHTFAIVEDSLCRCLAGKLLCSWFPEILQFTAHKQRFRAIRRNVVIEPRNKCIELGIGVRRKPVTQGVRAITGIFIRRGILIEDVQNALTYADVRRIHQLDLIRSQGIVPGLYTAYPIHRPPGATGVGSAVWTRSTQVHEITRPQSRAGHGPQDTGTLSVAPPFIVGKEEEPILHHRPSQRRAE